MHILFAEDTRSMALPVILFLESKGYRVTHVPDGSSAVDAFQELAPDLVLLDVVMPRMDGIEATRRIKRAGDSRWTPVVLMTSLSEADEIIEGLDAGADDYLIKPIVLGVLEARIRSMQRIAVIQQSLEAILDNVYEGIITIDEKGAIQSYNSAAERIFGYKPHEVQGRNVKCLMPEPFASEHDGYLVRYQKERTPRVIGIGRKVKGRRKNGEVFPMRLAVTEIRDHGAQGYVGVVSDISEEETTRERIEFMALHDPLTGLPNRTQFAEKLNAALDSLAGANGLAVMFVDLDGFKPVNDSLGHDAGDEALKVVAGRLRGHLNAGDFVARIGGDEFVVIARDICDEGAACGIGERLIAAISRPMTVLGDKSAQIGATIGVAIAPVHGMVASELLTAADNAMYAAKRLGKGRCMVAMEALQRVPGRD